MQPTLFQINENICFNAYLGNGLTKVSLRCSGQRDVKQKPRFVDSEQSTQTLARLSMNSAISLLLYTQGGKKSVLSPSCLRNITTSSCGRLSAREDGLLLNSRQRPARCKSSSRDLKPVNSINVHMSSFLCVNICCSPVQLIARDSNTNAGNDTLRDTRLHST